jgi:predicted DNA-binding transcriptional regulator AlpA
MGRVLSLAPMAVPTLDEVASNPERVTALPAGTLQGLLCRCLTVQAALFGALVATAAQASTGPTTEADRLLDVDAAAQRLGMSKDWLYHHAHQLPFAVRQGRLLRFSTAGIARYIRGRQGR